MEMFVFFACLASAFLLASAQNQTCDVGEGPEGGGGLCGSEATTTPRCQEFCVTKYGAELVAAVCSDVRANGKRECICKLRCVCGGCCCEPRYKTFDNDWSIRYRSGFAYQGTAKHILIKPINKYKSLPQFQITQTNKLCWGVNSCVESLELSIADWKQVVELRLADRPTVTPPTLTVNGNVKNIPFRYSNVQGHKENYISITYKDNLQTAVLETSFGLRLKLSYDLQHSSSVCMPRHPDLKNNSHGMLGRWNDNFGDDYIDANGIMQTTDIDFSWAFGDSWLVTPSEKKSKAEHEKAEKVHKEIVEKGKKDTPKMGRIVKLCNLFQDQSIMRCAKELGAVIPSPDECLIDAMYLNGVKEEEAYVCGAVNMFNIQCKLNVACGHKST